MTWSRLLSIPHCLMSFVTVGGLLAVVCSKVDLYLEDTEVWWCDCQNLCSVVFGRRVFKFRDQVWLPISCDSPTWWWSWHTFQQTSSARLWGLLWKLLKLRIVRLQGFTPVTVHAAKASDHSNEKLASWSTILQVQGIQRSSWSW